MSGHVSWGWVDRTLRALRSIWPSTTRPDGRPHAVPVWFTWDGSTLYVATQAGSQKARNLQHNPVEGTIVYRLGTWHAMAWMYGTVADRTDWWFDRHDIVRR